VRTNMLDHFGTPKNNKHILIYNTLQGCPEKVRKTGKYVLVNTVNVLKLWVLIFIHPGLYHGLVQAYNISSVTPLFSALGHLKNFY